MRRAILNKRFHAFPSLGNVFIIQLLKIYNITPQLDNLSRGVVLSNKSILALIPRIYAIPRQGLKPNFSSSSQGERKKLKLNNFTFTSLYFFISHNSTKLFKCKAASSPAPENCSFITRLSNAGLISYETGAVAYGAIGVKIK